MLITDCYSLAQKIEGIAHRIEYCQSYAWNLHSKVGYKHNFFHYMYNLSGCRKLQQYIFIIVLLLFSYPVP
jgi:hypothetical protein